MSQKYVVVLSPLEIGTLKVALDTFLENHQHEEEWTLTTEGVVDFLRKLEDSPRLTRTDTHALDLAIGNTLDHPDVVKELFGPGRRSNHVKATWEILRSELLK